ncbi:YCF48-related protein [Candidatus Venteria ishoeyi]|uniref:Ycf48-like protein n=1 Tax=Candidatus Venteria ishoeyi TaxID=1899563 RepID=A0A1H6F6C0_9GAMM|nr:YCF48-related protein [Candidatus Venteria ishoeyi]SEH04535.1 Ycf48-like protein precursor [Candidatus Venteria ishoeyi]
MKTIHLIFGLLFFFNSLNAYAAWQTIDLGLPEAMNFTDVQFVDEDHGFLSTDSGHVIYTRDGGQSWQHSTAATLKLNALFFVDQNTGWAVGSQGTLVHTQDGGQNWMPQTVPSAAELRDVYFVDNQIGAIVSSDTTHFLLTQDGGQSWELRTQNTQPNPAMGTTSVYLQDADHIWIANWAGRNGVEFTADGGQSWQLQATEPVYYLMDLGFTSQEQAWLIAYQVWGANPQADLDCSPQSGTETSTTSFLGYVYTTQNRGASWENVGHFCGYPRAGDFVDAQHGWIISELAIWHSQDGGVSWHETALEQQPEAIDMLNLDNGWAVGNNNLVLRYQSNMPTDPKKCRAQYDIATAMLYIPCLDVINPEQPQTYHATLQWQNPTPFGPIQFLLLDVGVVEQ